MTGDSTPDPSLRRQKVFYSFGQIGNGVYNGLNNGILGLYISAFTGNPFIIGYLSNTRTVEGAFIQPVVGRLSDRLTGPLGRRKPFILFGIPASVFFLSLVPVFSGAGKAVALPLIIVAIILFSTTWNIAGDPYQALMIDIIPPAQRSVYNAVLSVMALGGQVAILLYARSIAKHSIPNAIFYACVVILFVTYAVVFFGVREPPHAAVEAAKEERIPLGVYLRDLRRFREAMKLLVSIFFLWTGLNAILAYLTLYTKTEMKVGDAQAITIYLIAILSSGIFAYPAGRLGARYGNRRLIALGTAIMIVAAIGGTIAPSYNFLFPVAILAGLGFSSTTVLTYPYLSSLVPGSKIGVFTGLQASFSSIAVPLSTGVTALLILLFGYRSMFVLVAVMMAVDIAFLLAIDEAAAHRQIGEAEGTGL